MLETCDRFLLKNLERARQSQIKVHLGLEEGGYAVLTLHRPSNVDHRETFQGILGALESISALIPIVFPVHPRTRKTIADLGLSDQIENIKNLRLIDPLGYLDFLSLTAMLVSSTDSGGFRKTTALGIPISRSGKRRTSHDGHLDCDGPGTDQHES